MAEYKMTSPLGTYTLDLYPPDRKSTHRAWDAADSYLLDEIDEKQLSGPILIVNDSYGALSVSLSRYECYQMNDSASSLLSLQQNLQQNDLPSSYRKIENIKYSAVLIKIPKTLGLLEYQLRQIRQRISEKTLIIGAGMTRHIHNSTINLFASILGSTKTSLAKKKARLIFSHYNPDLEYPSEQKNPEYELTGLAKPLISLPNVFSQNKPDNGTRLLLKYIKLPAEKEFRIADFGCGNGIIGLFTASHYPLTKIEAIDDSLQAVKSARLNTENNGLTKQINIIHGNKLSLLNGPFDLILSNPPFHQGQKIDLKPTLTFFRETLETLIPGGHIRIVANHHLGYSSHLNKIFGNCRTLAENDGYVILDSERY